jgi:hypothetical protein
MSRSKLASEARTLGRAIFASLPFHIRAAAVFRALTKIAFQAGDETTVGLVALKAMLDADVVESKPGEGLFGADLEELKENYRRKPSAVVRTAEKLGTLLLKKGLNRYRNADDIHEVAIQKFVDGLLSSNPLNRGVKVGQAINFLVKRLWMEASTASRSSEFSTKERRKSVEDMTSILEDPSSWREIFGMDLRKVLDRIKRDPAFQGPQGEPRMYQYLVGKIEGRTDRAIAEALGLKATALHNWVNHSDRQRALRKHLEPLLLA